jgi:hypothetical protein
MALLTRVLQVFGGIVAGLALAEVGFWWHDDGAFPHLNLYVADPKLGVRLRPGGEERLRFATNPTTTIRINAEGYRGADWGPPVPDEVVVLGDSQVFGLGVEEDETASAVLATRLGRPVRNAGVPTWGPVEYLAALDELLARKPRTVVAVLNFSNDLFEVGAPNTGRHAIWDGWAVRIEHAPSDVTDFPGRSWLYNQSHLFFAMRRAWWTAPEDWSAGVASEGTWSRVVNAAAERTEPVDGAAVDAEVAGRQTQASRDRRKVEKSLTDLYFSVFPEVNATPEGFALDAVERNALPGDIVDEHGAVEEARSVAVTAQLLRQGADVRAGLEARLKTWADAHPKDKRATAIQEALAGREKSDAELSALATRVAEELGGRSPLTDFVREARDRCRAAGAELVVAALPLDVQVSADEWKKYGAEPQDMSATRVLLTDLVASAERLGVRAVDLTDALAAAEPGAFLDADLHMSARGQAAVAEAIARRMEGSRPIAYPGPGLPPGRSRVPTPAEMELAPEVVVKGSTKAHCSTRQLREWLLVWCMPRWGDVKSPPPDDAPWEYVYYEGKSSLPEGIVVVAGEEAMVGYVDHVYTALLTPLVPGHPVEADFWWSDRTERLSIGWDGDTPTMAFGPSDADTSPSTQPCTPDLDHSLWFGDFGRGCDQKACDTRRACAAGTRAILPDCAEGSVNAGSAGFCHALCDEEHPCASGTCSDWQGGRVCL